MQAAVFAEPTATFGQRAVVPSRKVTVPPRVASLLEMAAVKVTLSFRMLGFSLDVSATEVGLTLRTSPETEMMLGELPALELTVTEP